jgi:hypothetical protein
MIYPLNTNDPKEQILEAEEMFGKVALHSILEQPIKKPYLGDDIADYQRSMRFPRTSAEAFRDADYATAVWATGRTYNIVSEAIFALLAIAIVVTVIFKVFTLLITLN